MEEKRQKMLQVIKPICEAFKIRNFDYLIEDNHEILLIEDTRIGCDSNSEYAVITEIVGYLFIAYFKQRYLPFKTQTFNRIKEYWKKESRGN